VHEYVQISLITMMLLGVSFYLAHLHNRERRLLFFPYLSVCQSICSNSAALDGYSSNLVPNSISVKSAVTIQVSLKPDKNKKLYDNISLNPS
jgi:hypothetical protein